MLEASFRERYDLSTNYHVALNNEQALRADKINFCPQKTINNLSNAQSTEESALRFVDLCLINKAVTAFVIWLIFVTACFALNMH